MKFGLTEAELHWFMSTVVNPLKEQKAKVYIFGSRANDKYKKFSDVDVLYVEDANQPINSKIILNITTAAQDSRFPYKLDLVKYDELAASYKAGIDAEKIEL